METSMIKIALSGLVGFALGAGVTSVPSVTGIGRDRAAVVERGVASAPAAVDPAELMKNAKDLETTEISSHF
jgi:hypothetical protein